MHQITFKSCIFHITFYAELCINCHNDKKHLLIKIIEKKSDFRHRFLRCSASLQNALK
ncbi:hypothetical protein LTSEBAI_2195 [Salmonella enterica subsp. enterica serovar Baildon str. R6-199]|nr:hypothetical protein LTSEBAI_2195 [Salmonella enterica subsp. enterica serovar Baildon str. R6-199]